jgi:hypothetical protein
MTNSIKGKICLYLMASDLTKWPVNGRLKWTEHLEAVKSPEGTVPVVCYVPFNGVNYIMASR